jgi:Flp pilus assembly protein TadD
MPRRSIWIMVAVLAAFLTSTLNCSAVAQTNDASQTCYRDTNNGDYSGAVRKCSKAIDLNPNDESAYANRCLAYQQLSNFNAAIIDCT